MVHNGVTFTWQTLGEGILTCDIFCVVERTVGSSGGQGIVPVDIRDREISRGKPEDRADL